MMATTQAFDEQEHARDDLIDHVSKESMEPVVVSPRRSVVVEPVVLLYRLASAGMDPLLELYTHSRISEMYPILQNASMYNDTSKCANLSSADPFFVASKLVDAGTARWQIYLAVSGIGSMFTTLFFGAYSDVKGRRPIILFPSISMAISIAITLLVIYFKLPLFVLLISSFVNGMCGGYVTLILGVDAYLADTINPSRLGFRLLVVDVILGITVGLCQVGLGYSIENLGYFNTCVILQGFILLNLMYVIFFVPETVVLDSTRRFFFCSELKSTYKTLTEKDNNRHIKILLIILSFFFYNMYRQSDFSIRIIYVMDPPLCWGPRPIGIFIAGAIAAIEVASIIGLKLFQIWHVPEIGIAAIGILSGLCGCVVNTFANSLVLMIIVPCCQLFTLLPSSMFRTCASKLFREDEQGRVLSAITSVGAFTFSFSVSMMSAIFESTQSFFEGFVYIVFSGFCILSLVTILVYVMFEKRTDLRRNDSLLENEEYPNIN